MAALFRRDHRLYCKVYEAKNLNAEKQKSFDAYCIVSVDGKDVRKTSTLWDAKNPFWGEEFQFELPEADFQSLNVSIWSESNVGDDKMVGKINIPNSFVHYCKGNSVQDELWFPLLPPEIDLDVCGELKLKIVYSALENTHNFRVSILSARGLCGKDANGLADPYAAIHLLPDLNASTTKCTRVHKGTLSPSFNETFDFSITGNITELAEIHISMWDYNKISQHSFMGYLVIPLSQMPKIGSIEGWYRLVPKPLHAYSELIKNSSDKRKTRKITNDGTTPDFISIRDFVKICQTDGSESIPLKSRKCHRFVPTKFTSNIMCAHCFGVMEPESSQSGNRCGDCRYTCHQRCVQKALPNCGNIANIRLQLRYYDDIILPTVEYRDLFKLLNAENYLLPVILAKVSIDREETARILIKVFEARNKTIDLIKHCVEHEVNTTIDINTLFRANSMASKLIDVYMKYVGQEYLENVIGPTVRSFIDFKKSCEVDPTRLEKGEDIQKNWKNLFKHTKSVVETILQSKLKAPVSLRIILNHVRETVKRKFPTEGENTQYIAVSGFIFLRFFVPAIMGPRLFHIYEDSISMKTSRNLVLVAKSIQNIANFVEFGVKEPYMTPMNVYISTLFDPMKNYLYRVSQYLDDEIHASSDKIANFPEVDVGRELSRVKNICLKAYPDLKAYVDKDGNEVNQAIVTKLSVILEAISDAESMKSQTANRSESASNLVPKSVISMNELGGEEENLEQVLTPKKLDVQKQDLVDTKPAEFRKDIINFVKSVDKAALPADSNDVTSTETEFMLKHIIGAVLQIPHSTVVSPSNIDVVTEKVQNALQLAISKSSSNYTATESAQDTNNLINSLLADPVFSVADDRCEICQEVIDITETGGKAVQYKGFKFHEGHFKCYHCGQKFESEAIKNTNDPLKKPILRHGYSWCPEHVPKNPPKICGECKLPIAGAFIQALDKNWHPNHFTCRKCGCCLDGAQYMPLNGEAYCKTDYLLLTGYGCHACKKVIEAEFIEIDDLKYHLTCRLCAICGQTLAGKPFFTVDGALVCATHQLEGDQLKSRCFCCQREISGEAVEFEDRFYHPEHFRCYRCNLDLFDAASYNLLPFYTQDHEPFCETCFQREPK